MDDQDEDDQYVFINHQEDQFPKDQLEEDQFQKDQFEEDQIKKKKFKEIIDDFLKAYNIIKVNGEFVTLPGIKPDTKIYNFKRYEIQTKNSKRYALQIVNQRQQNNMKRFILFREKYFKKIKYRQYILNTYRLTQTDILELIRYNLDDQGKKLKQYFANKAASNHNRQFTEQPYPEDDRQCVGCTIAGGSKRKKKKQKKKVRKHKGIVQSGGKKGKLKKGYRYSGKKSSTGLALIVKCKKKKC